MLKVSRTVQRIAQLVTDRNPMMESTNKTDLPHRSAIMKRRSFFGYTLVGGVGVFSLKRLLSRFSGSTQSSNTEPQIMVSINPLAVPRTKENSETNG
jgi:hypothetical protein